LFFLLHFYKQKLCLPLIRDLQRQKLTFLPSSPSPATNLSLPSRVPPQHTLSRNRVQFRTSSFQNKKDRMKVKLLQPLFCLGIFNRVACCCFVDLGCER
ncbi:hypothetical protein LINPERHAP1_LOCUS16364, partial [Linum perenne]